MDVKLKNDEALKQYSPFRNSLTIPTIWDKNNWFEKKLTERK